MNKEELIGKLQMVYVGDRNALNELIGYYDGLKEIIGMVQQENKELKRNCNIGDENLKFYKEENTQLKSVIKEIREYINNTYDIPIAKGFPFPDKSVIDKKAKKDILQILDKGEK